MIDLLTPRDYMFMLMVFAFIAAVLLSFVVGALVGHFLRK